MNRSDLRDEMTAANFSPNLVDRVLAASESLDDLIAASPEQLDRLITSDDQVAIKALEATRFKQWVREQQEANSAAGEPRSPSQSAAAAAAAAAAATAGGEGARPPAGSVASLIQSSASSPSAGGGGAADAMAAPAPGVGGYSVSPADVGSALQLGPLGMQAAQLPPMHQQQQSADIGALASVNFAHVSPAAMQAFPTAISFQNHPGFLGQYPPYLPANFAESSMVAAAHVLANSNMPRPIPADVAVQLVSQQMQRRSGRWTDDEHEQFLKLMSQYGRSWTKISQVMKTRTEPQVRSHAQKYFLRLRRLEKNGSSSGANEGDSRVNGGKRPAPTASYDEVAKRAKDADGSSSNTLSNTAALVAAATQAVIQGQQFTTASYH